MTKIELVGPGRRRRFSDSQKQAIVLESFESGETVAGMARRYDISPSLLYLWRKTFKDRPVDDQDDEERGTLATASGFARAVVAAPPFGQEPIRVHVYEQIVVEIPAGADVASVSALVRSLRA